MTAMDEKVQTPRRRLVFIVSRDRMDLYDRLREALIREPDVDLILDRREGDRRLASSAVERERRGGQRRQQRAVEAEVRECGWAVLRLTVVSAARR
jgi:hypothetical protein